MSKYSPVGLPWSSGLGVDVSDCTTAKEVMEAAELNFVVDKCKLVAKMPFRINGNNEVNDDDSFVYNGNIYRDQVNAYATYRTDYNIPLGVVKSKYQVVQNNDAFNFFDEAIGEDKAQWQYAGFFGNGEKIFVTAKLPITTTVNNDPIDNYLVFSNSHDGSSSINIMFAPIRVICTNMLNAALKSSESYIRIRHTSSAKDKLDEGARILRVACDYAKSTEELYRSLSMVYMNDRQIMQYIAELILSEEENAKLLNYDSKTGYDKLFDRQYRAIEQSGVSTRKLNQMIAMFDYYLYGIGQIDIANSAWGAYNAITGYYCNVANLEGEKRADSLLYGTANNVMTKALNLAVNVKAA